MPPLRCARLTFADGGGASGSDEPMRDRASHLEGFAQADVLAQTTSCDRAWRPSDDDSPRTITPRRQLASVARCWLDPTTCSPCMTIESPTLRSWPPPTSESAAVLRRSFGLLSLLLPPEPPRALRTAELVRSSTAARDPTALASRPATEARSERRTPRFALLKRGRAHHEVRRAEISRSR